MTEAPVFIVDVCLCVGSWARCQKFKKKPLSWPCLSWQSFWNNSDSTGRVFMKLYIRESFEYLSTEFKFHCSVTTIICTLLDDRYTFLLGLAEYYLEW